MSRFTGRTKFMVVAVTAKGCNPCNRFKAQAELLREMLKGIDVELDITTFAVDGIGAPLPQGVVLKVSAYPTIFMVSKSEWENIKKGGIPSVIAVFNGNMLPDGSVVLTNGPFPSPDDVTGWARRSIDDLERKIATGKIADAGKSISMLPQGTSTGSSSASSGTFTAGPLPKTPLPDYISTTCSNKYVPQSYVRKS
jgi:hypothetical protein